MDEEENMKRCMVEVKQKIPGAHESEDEIYDVIACCVDTYILADVTAMRKVLNHN